MKLFNRLFKPKRKPKTPEELQQLRAEFSARFESFKKLIATNRVAMEKMAEIEERLHGDVPLSINFLRSRTATISKSVLQMITHLSEISPGKYDSLFKRYERIESRIAPFLASSLRPITDVPLAIPLTSLDISASDQTGEKMATLGEIHGGLGLDIPEGFVITANAYWHFIERSGLREKIYRQFQTADLNKIETVYSLSASVKQAIEAAPLPHDLLEAINAQYDRLAKRSDKDLPLAVRSSAQGEDLPGYSCAGMYKTLLGVSGENLAAGYKKVVASKYEARAIMYRLKYGIRDDDMAMCVGCMPLVSARCGGIAHSRNPLDIGDRRIMIHSVFGLPGPVTDGTAESDLIIISRDKQLAIEALAAVTKTHQVIYDAETGVQQVALPPEQQQKSSLDAASALALGRQLLMLEEYFGTPQDVEWAQNQDGTIVFLQSRVLLQRERLSIADTEAKDDDVDPAAVLATGEVTANQGVAAGPVHIVRQEEDILRFPEGGVLVVRQPLPDWAVALKTVAAVVAEQGSTAGHLANVAREVGIPALFSVKGATEILDPGTVITVDATRKKVYTGRIESRLSDRPKSPHTWVEDSPVYSTLSTMAKYITPLHLLEPNDPATFNPDACRTFHDIIRFCHEKAVQEMFHVGRRRRFPERSAKRLHVNVPTQFWIVDLKDGFKQGTANQRYVKLSDIVSAPMLALWWGMMAIPWRGPPVDARGFMAVLVESTSNPGLNPSMASPYTQRNYFMITRKYCSCQTRFGYHFSTVEALAGDRRQENFISFNFRGGAANAPRRQRRARLVGEILEAHDFRVHVVRDSVRARLEKYDFGFMEQRLKVVGYLMFHTRQLDMVLKSDDAFRYYRDKITADIDKLLKIEDPNS
ncbi:MAG: PEP/pyruvate-binding domain-containing protein [Myxococcota bacterium]|nr:PEP/pyruvate-binding domain-containing protein [Myxococcota bacterium]